MLKRFEVIGVYDDGVRPMSLPRARYRSYDDALARLDRERCVGAPGAYGMIVLPTRTVVHAPAAAPARDRDFYAGETCRCPRCEADGPTHPWSAVWATVDTADGARRRRCRACGALVALPTQAAASPALLDEPEAEAEPELEPVAEPEPEPLLTLVPDTGPVAVDVWPRAATA